MTKKNFLDTVKKAFNKNEATLSDEFLLKYYKLGAKTVIKIIEDLKKKRKKRKKIISTDFNSYYQNYINNVYKNEDNEDNEDNKDNEILQIEAPKDTEKTTDQPTTTGQPTTTDKPTNTDKPTTTEQTTTTDKPTNTDKPTTTEQTIKINEDENISIIDLISQNYTFLDFGTLPDEVLKEIETYYNNNYDGDYDKYIGDIQKLYSNIYTLALQKTDYDYNNISDTYKSYLLGEFLTALVDSNFDFNEVDLTTTSFYDINQYYYDVIANFRTIAQEENLILSNDEYNIYGNPEETIKINEDENISITDLISQNYTFLDFGTLPDEVLKEIETYYNNNYDGDYDKYIGDIQKLYSNIYTLALQKTDYDYNNISDTYKSYLLGEFLTALVDSNFDFNEVDLTTTSFYDINQYYYDVIANFRTIAQEENLMANNDEYNIYGTQEETIKMNEDENISIIDLISQNYTFLNTGAFTENQLKNIETYYNNNYNGNYEDFLNDFNESYKNMYESVLGSNYDYESLSDTFKSYFLSNYLYAFMRIDGNFEQLDSDNEYYQSVINSLKVISETEDLTKDNDKYNDYGQQELLLEPSTVDNTISINDIISENYEYLYTSQVSESIWSKIETYYNENYDGDYEKFLSDFETSYKNMYELALQYSNYSYDDLSDNFKSYFLGQYLDALGRSDGDFNELDLTKQDYDNDYYATTIFGLMEIAQEEDLTKDNEAYNIYGQQELLLEPVEIELNPDGTIKEDPDTSQTAADLADMLKGDTTKTDATLTDKAEPTGDGQDPSKTASDLVNVLKGTSDKTDGDVSDKTDTSKTAEDLVDIIENKSVVKDELRALQEVATNSENTAVAVLDENGQIVEQTAGAISTSYSANNNRNIMQQTDYIGPVNIRVDEEENKIVQIDNYAKFNGKDIYHIYDRNTDKKVTLDEWRYIIGSYEQDKYIRLTDDLIKQYGSFDNVYDYYTITAMNNKFFKDWLDLKIKGLESESFLAYMMPGAEYSKGLSVNYQNKDYNAHKREAEIKDIENMGINNVGSFLLCSAVVSFFYTIILKNIKTISDTPIIKNYESSDNTEKDLLASGLYSRGSRLEELLKSGELGENQRKVIEESIKGKSYKNLSQFRISNRYGAIISAFFGTLDDRTHALKNNSGVVLFNIVLLCLGYIGSYMDQLNSMNIDIDINSNLVKIISGFLSYFYPSDKYDGELIRGIENIINTFKSEIKNIHRGVNNSVNLQTFIDSVITQLIHICFSMTSTDFNVENFINKNTREHIINNFGTQIYYNLSSPRGLIDMLTMGFVDNAQFNKFIKTLMIISLSDYYSYDGVELFDVYFMSKVQAMTFLNNSKNNHLISVLHPELIDILSIVPVNVNINIFDPEIIGFIDYYEPEQVNILDSFIKEQVETYQPFEDPIIFDNEEDAEKHKAYVNNTIGENVYNTVEKTEKGGFIAGSKEERDKLNIDTIIDITGLNQEAIKKGGRDDTLGGVMTVFNDNDEFTDDNKIYLDSNNDYKATQLLDFLNNNYDIDENEIRDKLSDIIEDIDNKMIFLGSGDKDYMIIKDTKQDKLFIIFRGSQTGFDWFKNIEGFNKNYHDGIYDIYKQNEKNLKDTIKKLHGDNTKIEIFSHSRGHGLATFLLSDLIKDNYNNMRLASFGGYDVLTKDGPININELNEQILNKKIDVLNYVDENDEVDKYINNYFGYNQFGKKILIKSNEENKAYEEVRKNIIKYTKQFVLGFTSKKYKPIVEAGAVVADKLSEKVTDYTQSGLKHSIDNYKKLFKNDNYINKFRKEIKESTFYEQSPFYNLELVVKTGIVVSLLSSLYTVITFRKGIYRNYIKPITYYLSSIFAQRFKNNDDIMTDNEFNQLVNDIMTDNEFNQLIADI